MDEELEEGVWQFEPGFDFAGRMAQPYAQVLRKSFQLPLAC